MRSRLRPLWALSAALFSQLSHAQTAAPVAKPASTTAVAAPTESPGPIAQWPRAGLSLGQAAARFQRENLKVAAAKYEISAARADIIAAGLLSNPNLSLGANLRVHGEPQGADREYSIRLAQSLPLWGRLGANREAAELNASATEREFAAFAWEQLGALRRAYLGLQLAQAHRAVLAAGLADLERVQRVLDARAAAGANPNYDRVRLEVERGNLRARVALDDVRVSEASAELASAIGDTPTPEELLASDALGEPRHDDAQAQALLRRALEHRPEIAASQLQTSAAEARVRATRRRFVPEPELGVGYSRWSGIPGYPSNTVGGALLVSVSLPIPVFDRGQGSIERQVEQTQAARVRERDTRNGIEREVELARRAVALSTAAYMAYRAEASPQAESVRRIAEVIYREGRATILELLDAYSSYLRVEEQALELRGAALNAALALEQAVGP
jgi:outer membrane protein, heavy metal efflux system